MAVGYRFPKILFGVSIPTNYHVYLYLFKNTGVTIIIVKHQTITICEISTV